MSLQQNADIFAGHILEHLTHCYPLFAWECHAETSCLDVTITAEAKITINDKLYTFKAKHCLDGRKLSYAAFVLGCHIMRQLADRLGNREAIRHIVGGKDD